MQDKPKTTQNPFASKTIMKTITQQLNVKDFPLIIKDNKKTHSEDSDRSWIKREYNSEGYLTFSEDRTGYWIKREYNSEGFETFTIDSNTSWIKREYDSEGKEIYSRNSADEIIDNRP